MQITVKESVYIYAALLLLILPLSWLLSLLVAIAVHELGHFSMVKLLGGKVYNMQISVRGMNMQCLQMQTWKRVLAVLSGPLFGFLLAILTSPLPKLALCSWVLSVYNLLPIVPLDGGHALEILWGESRYFALLQKVFLGIACLCAVYSSIFLGFGLLPLVIVVGLWLRNRNIPCKLCRGKVQ